MKKLSIVVLAILALSACSTRYASNGEELYLNSRNGVKLEVPPPLTDANISHYYDLPPQNQDARVSIAPPVNKIITYVIKTYHSVIRNLFRKLFHISS